MAHPLPLAVTMGDAAGIGPEIIARHFATEKPSDLIVVGDLAQMERAIRLIGADIPVVRIEEPAPARPEAWPCCQRELFPPICPMEQSMRVPGSSPMRRFSRASALREPDQSRESSPRRFTRKHFMRPACPSGAHGNSRA